MDNTRWKLHFVSPDNLYLMFRASLVAFVRQLSLFDIIYYMIDSVSVTKQRLFVFSAETSAQGDKLMSRLGICVSFLLGNVFIT